MAQIHDSMIDPRIEQLLSKVDSRFTLVSLGAQRDQTIVVEDPIHGPKRALLHR